MFDTQTVRVRVKQSGIYSPYRVLTLTMPSWYDDADLSFEDYINDPAIRATEDHQP